MFIVEANSKKNRLYFQLRGRVDNDESSQILNSTIRELEKLKPGFEFLSDTDDLIPLTEVARITVDNTIKTIKEHGVNNNISIIDKISPNKSFKTTIKKNYKKFESTLT